MTEGKTDANILDGCPLTTTFNDVVYTWRERPRREQRKARSRLMEIVTLCGAGMQGDDMAKASISIDAINAILEFGEDFNEDFAKDIDAIEAHIKANGLVCAMALISDVFTPLFEAWLKPWISVDGADDTGKK